MSYPSIFTHAGDIGDMIYGLAVVKALGGGSMVLTSNHTMREDLKPRVGFNPESYAFVKPLLERQPYITDVCYIHQQPFATVDLNHFRLHWRGLLTAEYQRRGWQPPYSLQQMHAATFGVALDDAQPWLEADHTWGPAVLFARSARYHNASFPWQVIVDRYRPHAAFIGTEAEHTAFCDAFGEVPYHPVRNARHMASLMKASRLVVANQSAPYAIAEGLKVCTIQETRNDRPDGADCLFKRPNAQFVIDGKVELPNV